jgi:predicted dehydrogenase
MDKIRLCLAGAGRAGEVHGDVYHLSVPNSQITAVFDTDIAKAKNLANKYNIDEKFAFKSYEDALSFAKFDAAVITTPTFTHCRYTQMSAQNKINVFCEKPMAISEEDCSKMIDSCKEAKVILQIGFMRRFDVGFASAKAMIESGEIGEPLIISSVGRGL